MEYNQINVPERMIEEYNKAWGIDVRKLEGKVIMGKKIVILWKPRCPKCDSTNIVIHCTREWKKCLDCGEGF